MSAGGYRRWSFREADSFPLAKAALRMDPVEFDEHMWAIEDVLLTDPIQWSAARPGWGYGVRAAVSEPTQASPNALILAFRLEGTTILKLWVLHR